MIGPGEAKVRLGTVARMISAMRGSTVVESGLLDEPALEASIAWLAHPGSPAQSLASGQAVGGISFILAGECWPMEREVLAQLYETHGDGFLGRLEGLFSGVLVDRRRSRILLFNDRYPGERLYAFRRGEVVWFASEAKALLEVLPELRAWDEEGVAEFLEFGCTLRGRSLFRGLSALPGAALWCFERTGVSHRLYFHPESWLGESTLDTETFRRAFFEAFPARLAKYVRAEDRLGMSITGGLDTRMIMASLPDGASNVVCYTYAGPHGLTADARLGAAVAQALGLEHHVLRVDERFVMQLPELIDRTVRATDGCAGPLHAHEIYLSERAAALAGIRLTGNYGSEVLRGVSMFKRAGLMSAIVDPDLRKRMATVRSQAIHAHPVYNAAFVEIPWLLLGTLMAARTALSVRTPYLDTEIVRLAFRAPSQARADSNVACDLIRTRHPIIACIPTDRGELPSGEPMLARLMRRTVAALSFKLDYWHKEGLPERLAFASPVLASLEGTTLLGQHKYLPYRQWFRHALAEHLREVIHSGAIRGQPFWNRSRLERLLLEVLAGRRSGLRELHAVLSLDAVERTLMRSGATQ